MADIPPYPPIDPNNYDLIVVGTGLPESLIAAAASSAGKSVLHLDPNPFYGSHFSSLSLLELSSFLNSHYTSPSSPMSASIPPTNDNGFTVVALTTRPLYSSVEISNFASEILEEQSRKFNIDIAGPRALFCADKAVELMLKSGASQYMEFKSIDASFIGGEPDGKLLSVPDSRAAIFKDRSLALPEKNQLMRFFKLVQGHLTASSGNEDNTKISEEDLGIPFVDFLTKMQLPPKIKWIILYAIAMADYDQDSISCKDRLKTKDGIDRLALYSSSVGRFTNALDALIYPIYGQGELPQAFCRRAAVKGCLYVLRMPVTALLLDKDSGNVKGVRLASGQDIFSHKLVLDPSLTVSLPLASSISDPLEKSLKVLISRNNKGKVARGICITRNSVKPDTSNIVVVYPPRSLFPEQVTAVRVVQLGSSLAVCPSGMYVLYLSALCDDDIQGKKLLDAAMNSLLKLPVSKDPGSSSSAQNDDEKVEKLILLWKSLYIQELTVGHFDTISFTPMPDGNLTYNCIIEASCELFQQIFPDEEFFPEATSPENAEDESSSLSLET